MLFSVFVASLSLLFILPLNSYALPFSTHIIDTYLNISENEMNRFSCDVEGPSEWKGNRRMSSRSAPPKSNYSEDVLYTHTRNEDIHAVHISFSRKVKHEKWIFDSTDQIPRRSYSSLCRFSTSQYFPFHSRMRLSNDEHNNTPDAVVLVYEYYFNFSYKHSGEICKSLLTLFFYILHSMRW